MLILYQPNITAGIWYLFRTHLSYLLQKPVLSHYSPRLICTYAAPTAFICLPFIRQYLLCMDHVFVVSLRITKPNHVPVGNKEESHKSQHFFANSSYYIIAMALHLSSDDTLLSWQLSIFLHTGPQHQPDRFGNCQISPIVFLFLQDTMLH